MIIKDMQPADVQQSLKEIRQYFDEANKDRKKIWNKSEAKDIIDNCISSDTDIALCARDNNEIIGISLLRGILPYMETDLAAFEMIWHSDTKLGKIKRIKILLGLLVESEKKAIEKNMRSITIGVPKGSPLIRALKNRGYEEGDIILKKELKNGA